MSYDYSTRPTVRISAYIYYVYTISRLLNLAGVPTTPVCSLLRGPRCELAARAAQLAAARTMMCTPATCSTANASLYLFSLFTRRVPFNSQYSTQ